MKEIAKLDTRGDMVASPLSQIKAFGFGSGGTRQVSPLSRGT